MKMSFGLQQLANNILPGFGAFGKDPRSNLSIPIGRLIDRVVLTVTAPSLEFINLFAPVFYDAAGLEIPQRSIYADVTLSSHRPEHEPEDLLEFAVTGNMLHSGREISPALVVRLKSPVFVSKITVANRDGIYHKRSRYLTLRAFHKGICCATYDNMDPARHIEALRKLAGVCGFELPATDDFDLEAVTTSMRTSVLSAADRGMLDLNLEDMFALLPMFDGIQDPDDYQEAICAAMVTALLKGRTYAGTRDLRFAAQFMHSDRIIDRVRARACAVASHVSGSPREITLSKHHVHYARLIERCEEHLNALDKIFSVFEKLEIPLVLSYGTALGAVREGTFLAHDDDVDLLYFDGAGSQEEMIANQQILIEKLNAAGVKCGGEPLGKNFHVFLNGVSLDLFPSWKVGDRLHLLMEQMRYRDIAADLVLPPGSARIHGRTYPAPRDATGFLTERYSAAWPTPDIYYGWPWKVTQTQEHAEEFKAVATA